MYISTQLPVQTGVNSTEPVLQVQTHDSAEVKYGGFYDVYINQPFRISSRTCLLEMVTSLKVKTLLLNLAPKHKIDYNLNILATRCSLLGPL